MTVGRGAYTELEHSKQQPTLLQRRLVTTVFRRGRVFGGTKRGKTMCPCRQRVLLHIGSCKLLELSIAITAHYYFFRSLVLSTCRQGRRKQ